MVFVFRRTEQCGKRTTKAKKGPTQGKAEYEKVEGDRTTKAACCEQNDALSFVRRVESLSNSESPNGTGARKTYTSANVPNAVIQITSPTM